MARQLATKKKDEAPVYEKCRTCYKTDKAPEYRMPYGGKAFCSKKCRDVYFNGYEFPIDSFKIQT